MSQLELAIPRSGSVLEKDADYDPFLVRIGARIDVLLDGEPVRKVIAFNCDEGWVRAYKVNTSGFMYLENGTVAEHTLHGNVSVRWR